MKYSIGMKIKILSMDGEPNYKGRIGVITSIDDKGRLHGTWGGLAVDLEYDYIEIID